MTPLHLNATKVLAIWNLTLEKFTTWTSAQLSFTTWGKLSIRCRNPTKCCSALIPTPCPHQCQSFTSPSPSCLMHSALFSAAHAVWLNPHSDKYGNYSDSKYLHVTWYLIIMTNTWYIKWEDSVEVELKKSVRGKSTCWSHMNKKHKQKEVVVCFDASE